MFELLFGQRRQNSASTAVAEPGIDRKAELLDEIRDLDGALENQDATMRAFRLEHMAVVNNHAVLLYARGANIGQARAEIEVAWQRLCEQRQAIQKLRNDVLQQLGKYS